MLATGCAVPPRQSDPVQRMFPAASPEQRDDILTRSAQVLREHGFKIDRLDRRDGVVTTFPQTSQQFFEFWRKDVDTAYDWIEASMRTVRRSVTVRAYPADSGEKTQVRLTVHRETFATPERQFNNSIAAFRMFGDDLPAERTGLRVSRADDYWIDAGTDPAMETYLMDQITNRIAS